MNHHHPPPNPHRSPGISTYFNRKSNRSKGESVTNPEQRAKTTSRRTGTFATLSNLLRGQGSSAPSLRPATLASRPQPTKAEQAHLLASVGPRRRALLSAALSLATTALLALAAAPALADTAPAVTIGAATSITATSAHFAGEVNPEGGPSTTFWQLQYAHNAADEGWTFAVSGEFSGTEASQTTPLPIEGDLSGLLPHTEYEVRLLASNEGGEAIPSETSFTTKAAAPRIAATFVTGVTKNEATLDAKVAPEGAETTVHFEYLTEEQFKNEGGFASPHTEETPESASIGEDNSSHRVSATITELAPGATYRYRAVARNSIETVDGPANAFKTFAPAAPFEECPNQLRSEQGPAYLPDCRAYELVTPADKDSGEPEAIPHGQLLEAPLTGIKGARAASDGNRMAWDSELNILPGSQSFGLDYLSTRGEDGWSSENVIPPQSVQNGLLCPILVGIVGWSADLSQGVLADGFGQATGRKGFFGEGYECGHDEPRLVAGEPEGFQNLFLRNSDTHTYQLVNVTPSGVTPPTPPEESIVQFFRASFLAGSADLSRVVFEEELKLTPEAPEGDDLYEWSDGSVHLVTILPNGLPVAGALAGATKNVTIVRATGSVPALNVASARHAVSADGTRVFFQAEGTEGNLFVRENGEQPQSPLGADGECTDPTGACTLQVDASQAGGPGGGGRFMAASKSGSKVFFLDDASAGLTANTTPGSGQNLYEYDLESGSLTDLTTGPDARVLGISGAGEDGSHVYFVAEGALEGTGGASAGQPNLYVYDNGAPTFIATLDASADACDWVSENVFCGGIGESGLTARVSANGTFIGFPSIRSLTGYDNTDLHTGNPDAEVFLYDAAANALTCASCDPSGAAPSAPGVIRYPAQPDTNEEQHTAYLQRNVSDSGQVFFETSDQLLPSAANGKRNVYEYEHGLLSLISTGTSEADSYFLDATPNGSDVFFVTAQRLLPRDKDSAYDIYDARVGGGFSEPPSPPGPCAGGEGCRGAHPDGAPALPAPASASFSGPGNLSGARKLARQLKACRKQPRRKRRSCERSVRRRFDPAPSGGRR